MRRCSRAVIRGVVFWAVILVGSAQAMAEEDHLQVEETVEDDGGGGIGPGSVEAAEVVEENGLDRDLESPQIQERDLSWRWLLGGQAFGLIGGTIWYVLDEQTNRVDYDYEGIYTGDSVIDEGNMSPRELKPQSEVWRGLDGFRFEDNAMVLNTPLHPMAGAGYHILARSSSLGLGASALVTNITSAVWEGGIEHMEVFSINDQILTATGGVPLGEAYFQLGQFFRSAEPTRLNRAMSWVFGLPAQLRDRIHGYDRPDAGAYGDRGWPDDIWHRFTIEPRFSVASSRGGDQTDFTDPRVDGELAVAVELVRLPDYRKSGDHAQWIAGPVYSSLEANLAFGRDVYDWGIAADLDIAGFYRHRVDGEFDEQRGASLFVGTGMGFRHFQRRHDDRGDYDESRFRDRYGIVHFPGLRLDASWLTDRADVRLRYGATPDFSAIESRAYRDFWTAAEDDYRGFQTVVEKQGYYYGAGFSSRLNLEIDIEPMHLHWDWDLHWARSIDRADRFKDHEDFKRYLTMTDLISTHEVGAMVSLPVSNLRAGLTGEYRQRAGTLEDRGAEGGDGQLVESRTSEMRGLGVLQLVY